MGTRGRKTVNNEAEWAEWTDEEAKSAITSTPSKQLNGSYDKLHTTNGIWAVLSSLPPEFEGGFMTGVAGADENFEGGEPLNIGVKNG